MSDKIKIGKPGKANDPDDFKTRLNKILLLQRENDIISMLLEGKETKDIRSYLLNKYEITQGTANFLITAASSKIKKRENWEVDNLVAIHIERYDIIYNMLYDLGAYGNATNALKAKEKLMGFHREGFHMKVTQGEIQQLSLKHVANEYDLTKLPVEKQTRIEELFNKVKRKNGKD